MLARLTNLVLQRPKAVLLVVLLVVLTAGTMASGLQKRVTAGGYEDEGSEAKQTSAYIERTFGRSEPNLVLVVSDRRGADNPQVAAAGQALTQRLAKEHDVNQVQSYWSLGRPPALRANNGAQALVLAHIQGNFDDRIDRAKELRPRYTGTVDGLQVKLGGESLLWQENIKQAQDDVTKADGLVFPLTLLVLALIFGSIVAALLPLAVAFATMLVSMALMWGLTFATDTSNVVANITTFLSLGLAIDYSLLIVYRYREELRRGLATNHAIVNSVRSAGRTVAFSSVTMAVAFASVLVLPFPFLRSLAWSCMAVALVAAAASLLVVPALLAWLGARIDKWQILRAKRRPAAVETSAVESGYWHRLATIVMRRPIPVALLVLVVVALLGAPAMNMKLRLPDEQVLPKSAQAAEVYQTIKANFNTRELDAIQVVAPNVANPAGRANDISGYAQRLSGLPSVARVDALTGSYAQGRQVAGPSALSQGFAARNATYLSVVPSVDGYSETGKTLVRNIRDTAAPFKVNLAGPPVVNVDTFDTLYDRLPYAGAVLVIGMFVLLFLLTGSVVLPLVAIVLSALSLSAVFGAVVYIFQDGHLQSVVGDFIATGALTWLIPVTIFGLAFGLSMDYPVFMFSRIKEEYDRTGDNATAVAVGLERTGKVVTYAAILISTVFAVWITSGLNYMKAFAVGIPLAILMDATIIRGMLLPAVMRLLGRASWWAPGPLRALHRRIGLSESSKPVTVPAATADQVPVEVGE
jgi:RND superfamily putative drug exporter